MDTDVKRYLASIGKKGGTKSRRTLDPETSRNMVKIREARRAFRIYHAACFWSYSPDLTIGLQDIPWITAQLMKHGDRRAWELGAKLCR